MYCVLNILLLDVLAFYTFIWFVLSLDVPKKKIQTPQIEYIYMKYNNEIC